MLVRLSRHTASEAADLITPPAKEDLPDVVDNLSPGTEDDASRADVTAAAVAAVNGPGGKQATAVATARDKNVDKDDSDGDQTRLDLQLLELVASRAKDASGQVTCCLSMSVWVMCSCMCRHMPRPVCFIRLDNQQRGYSLNFDMYLPFACLAHGWVCSFCIM